MNDKRDGQPTARAPDISNRAAQQSHVDFLHDLYLQGIPLSIDQYRILVDNEKINEVPTHEREYIGNKAVQPDGKASVHARNRIDSVLRHRKKKKNLDNMDVIQKDVYETEATEKDLVYSVEKLITQADWKPESIIHHSKEFVSWINSVNSGFANRIVYEPFEYYKMQAEDWMEGDHSIEDFTEEEERYEYMMRELERCSINSLYAANKYYWLKDEAGAVGKIKYDATEYYEHQRICCYLFDCGYSLIIGKPRQPGITSIFGILGMNRVLNRKNYFLKFIAEDKRTSEEIFEDKIKFSFESLEGWFKPNTNGKPDVVNDRDNLFRIGRKGPKGRIDGLNSKIVVTPPYRTAINGGSPPLVFVDEIGSIDILTEMVNEGRPTMFRRNRQGEFEIKGQLVMWGTGTTGKGGGAFENEWKRILGLWNEGDYTVGIVPLFFDWTTRCSEEEYLAQKAYYYGSRAKEEGIDIETSKVQFHQHYPTSPADMFSTTKKTIIGREEIDKNITRINKVDPVLRVQYGYFEPIYDKTRPMDENSDVPYRIVGANFVPTDEFSELASAIMFQRPKTKPAWVNRYYQGTDPISADTGTSRMASAIWDVHYNTVSCLINHRKLNDPDASFLQCLLMGLYYDVEKNRGVPELLEKNIGLAYKNYKSNKGFLGTLMYNAELPDHLQSGSNSDLGIDNKGYRNKAIINEMYKVFTLFGEKIYIPTPFEQLRTFVCDITRSGNETWGPVDSRYYHDDALWAIVFAYIAALSHMHLVPKSTEEVAEKRKYRWETYYDENFNLKRRQVPTAHKQTA